MKDECYNCKPVIEALQRNKIPSEGNLAALHWIVTYRDNYESMETCFDKICLPLLLLANGEISASRTKTESTSLPTKPKS